MFRQDVNQVRSALLAHWALPEPLRLTALPGGATAEVWRVTDGSDHGHDRIAKLVYGAPAEVEPGLAVAEAVQDRTGIRTGTPIRTTAGQLSVLIPTLPGERHPLALLDDVSGVPVSAPTGLPPEPAAELLARVHRATPPVEVPGLDIRLRYLEDDAHQIAHPERLWPALASVAREIRELSADLTSAICYGDGPELFAGPDGTLGLIDWGGVLCGPVLYDVAIWSRGWASERERFLSTYAEAAGLPTAELAYVDSFDRLNAAHQLRFRAYRMARAEHYYETEVAADDNAARVRELAARLGVQLP